jgi:hypothetical protein
VPPDILLEVFAVDIIDRERHHLANDALYPEWDEQEEP